MKKINLLFAFTVLTTLFTLNSCNIEPLDPALSSQIDNGNPQLAVIVTRSVSDITASSVTTGGNITSDGGLSISSRGVVWSVNQNPTLSDNNTVDGSGVGSYTSSISGLVAGNTYYVRAYAINSSGVSYGNQVMFTTVVASNLPVLITTPVTNNIYPSAVSGGNISADGGSPVTARGVVWSTSSNPVLPSTRKTIDGSGMGSYVSTIQQLQIVPGSVIYLRAYATNANGTAYGNEVSFTAAVSQVDNSPALMTANINGIQYDNMKPFLYSITGNDVVVLNDGAPVGDTRYLKIQGDTSDNLGFLTEINLHIPNDKWVLGTYQLYETFDLSGPSYCQASLILPNVGGAPDYARVTGGSITITEFNLVTKRIKGTFNITYEKTGQSTVYEITNGTFNYGLDNSYFD